MNTITLPTTNGWTLVLSVPNGSVDYRFLPPVGEAVTQSILLDTLVTLTTKVEAMNQALQTALDQVAAAVAAEATVESGAVALITGLVKQMSDVQAQLAAQGVTPDQLKALSDLTAQIQTNAAPLSAAVSANTPAAPAPVSADPAPAPVSTDPAPVPPAPIATDPAPAPVADPAPVSADAPLPAPGSVDPAPVAADPAASAPAADPNAPTGTPFVPTAG